MGPPKMVGTARDRLEAGAGAERTSGSGGRNIHGCNCRDDNDDDGRRHQDREMEQGRRRHWEPVTPVGRNGAGRNIKAYSFQRPEIHGENNVAN